MVSQCRKISWVSLQCFWNFVVSGKFAHNSGVTFFSRKFFVSQYRKLSWESLQCLENFRVSKKFMDNTGYHVSPSKILSLTEPKVCVKESYCFWENFWFRKVFTDEKGGVIHFSVEKNMVSQCQKLSWESLQCLEKFRFSKNFMHYTGYHVFPSKILCLTVPKIFVGIPSMFQKNSGIEKKLCILGMSRFSAGNCLSHSAENFCEGILLTLRKFLIPKTVYG